MNQAYNLLLALQIARFFKASIKFTTYDGIKKTIQGQTGHPIDISDLWLRAIQLGTYGSICKGSLEAQ